MPLSRAAVTGTSADRRSEEADADRHGGPSGLARKLTCSVASTTAIGVLLLLACQVALTLTSVPSWGSSTKKAMISLERENLGRVADAKAEFITENFGRVQESVLQLQAFAGQAAVAVPETMTVEAYLTLHSGLLEESEEDFDYSVWFIPEFASDEFPEAGSSLEGLLNRSSLMDVPFRGIQRQHDRLYLAALDDPSAPTTSQINFQSHAAQDMSGDVYVKWGETEDCDERHLGEDFDGTSYEPRCRIWYQDAIEEGNTAAIITNRYTDVDSLRQIMSAAAPVFDSSGAVTLGVVGLDIFTEAIEISIQDLRVIGDEGYAYVLAPGGEGQVAFHEKLSASDETDIFQVEDGVDEDEFRGILGMMSDDCAGSASYSNFGENWLLSWSHETASTGSSPSSCVADGFVVVVTVSEAALLNVFSKTEMEIAGVVVVAACVMAAVLLVIMCCTAGSARGLSTSITAPVNQLVDVVTSLNRLDFSRQAAGTWMVNDVTSPEVEELMTAFEAMSTVVKFANMSLTSGDVDVAVDNYIEAKVLFSILGNDRGVSIVHNNLGIAYTLQARELVAEAARIAAPGDDDGKGGGGDGDVARAQILLKCADERFCDAVTTLEMAIEDARMLCSGETQLHEEDGEQKHHDHGADENLKAGKQLGPRVDLEAGGTAAQGGGGGGGDDDPSSSSALTLQLANRKFNLALCLAAKGNSAVFLGGSPDLNAINTARRLMFECAQFAAERKDAMGDQRQVECLLEVAKLERAVPGRHREAEEALDAAERVVQSYHGSGLGSGGGGGGGGGVHVGVKVPAPTSEGAAEPPPLAALRQQLLAARGTYCVAGGDVQAGVVHWTDAVIGCGERMDVAAVRVSLEGLRQQAQNGTPLPHKLLEALGVRDPPGESGKRDAVGVCRVGADKARVVGAMDAALEKLDEEARKCRGGVEGRAPVVGTRVDLCFVMDCTRSMQSWIDQAKSKLTAIIEQTKKDIANIELRVAFVGYRDYGDKVRYEGPYDFHTEAEMPKLLNKLKNIKAVGGLDVPEDVAGGLNHAVGLSWRSPIRLCILIADAPCHGLIYHGHRDNYPKGCPKGLDPSELLFTLQYELGVDVYFVRITSVTDKMISVLENTVTTLAQQGRRSSSSRRRQHPRSIVRRGDRGVGGDGDETKAPRIVVHNLGSDDNRFLDTVVKSVKASVINLRLERY